MPLQVLQVHGMLTIIAAVTSVLVGAHRFWKTNVLREILCTCGHSMSAHSASSTLPETNTMALGLLQAKEKRHEVAAPSTLYDGRKKKEHPSNQEVRDRLLTTQSLALASEARCLCKINYPCTKNLFTHDGTSWDGPLDGLRHIRWAQLVTCKQSDLLVATCTGGFCGTRPTLSEGVGCLASSLAFMISMNGKEMKRATWSQLVARH